jgi:hypothetical protein
VAACSARRDLRGIWGFSPDRVATMAGNSEESNTHPLLYAPPEIPAHGSVRVGCFAGLRMQCGRVVCRERGRGWAPRVLLIHERVVHEMRFTTRTDRELFRLAQAELKVPQAHT